MLINHKNKKRGFSLVELVVVIAILAVIAAIFVPSLVGYTEDSRAKADYSAADEITNAIQLAINSDPNCYQEMYNYSCSNNFVTYTDSSGTYGTQVKDREFYAPDGMGRATTITFNPVESNGRTVYKIADAYINDITYGNGSTGPNRVMEGSIVANNQCYFKEAKLSAAETYSATYNKVRMVVGEEVELSSRTYKNSSLTVFITFEEFNGMPLVEVDGMFNGTNLKGSTSASVGSGTTSYIENENGQKVPAQDNESGGGGTVDPDWESSSQTNNNVSGKPSYKEEIAYKGICAVLYSDGTLAFQYTSKRNQNYGEIKKIYEGEGEGGFLTIQQIGTAEVPWYEDRLEIKRVVTNYAIKPVSVKSWFEGLTNCTSMDLSKLDISECTDLTRVFYNCTSLESVDVSHFNTSNIILFDRTFFGCEKLQNIDVSKWDTSKATKMIYTFDACKSLIALNVSNWDTSKCESFQRMFVQCAKLTSLDVRNWNTSKVKDMAYMFSGCHSLSSIDLSQWDTGNVTTMYSMFQECYAISTVAVDNWNMSKCTDIAYMFRGSGVNTLNVSKWDTGNIKSMNYAFANLDCPILDVSNWDTSSATNMTRMFYVSTIKNLDVSKWDTSNVTGMAFMFGACRQLQSLDCRSWDTSKVVSFGYMFQQCYELENIYGLENFNTSSAIDFAYMFDSCKKLTVLDLSNFDTRKANSGTKITNMHTSQTMYSMFKEMVRLEKVILGANFTFNGDGTSPEDVAILPTNKSEYWYNQTTGVQYAAESVPNGAGTYAITPPA